MGVVLGLALIAFATSPAHAVNILFDPDGAGGLNGTTSISGLDFNAGNALTIGARNEILRVAQGGTPNSNLSFTTLYQASLNGFLSPSVQIAGLNGAIGQTGSFEITIVAQFQETLVGASFSGSGLNAKGTADFELAANQTGSFFNIYYRDLSAPGAVKSNDQTGTNFANGTLILAGTPNGGFSNTTSFKTFTDPTLVTGIDQRNSSDPRLTAPGSGDALLGGFVDSTDANFFKNIEKIISASFKTNLSLPFDGVSATRNFAFYNGGAGYTPDNGLPQINGLTSNDFQFQADANITFVLAPEPGTVASAIGGLLLTSVGMVIRRRKTA